jgi:NAD(P)H-quinone oxidoreductase subunit 5
MNAAGLVFWCAVSVVGAPLLLLIVLGAASFAGRPLPERATGLATRTALTAAFACLAVVVIHVFASPHAVLHVEAGRWFAAPGYALEVNFLFDRLSLAFAALTIVLGGVVAVFAERYMHREPGFNRFFVLLAMFVSGLLVTTLARSVELICAGWELVGLSSALLIAFFHERPAPVRNGLRAFVVYRGCDAGLLAAAVLVHHWCGSGDLVALLGVGPWPSGSVALPPGQIAVIAAAVLIAALGKSAQLPFSGWLPRAMEGPTPSSAIFYGALSVHAGAYLLLRLGPLLDRTPSIAAAVVVVGLLTALHATIVGRVQTDVKCALAYASLTQVGIIFVEIGLGLRMIALAHVAGHACLRSLQFLRAPSLLHDFHQAQNAVGGHLARTGVHFERWVPARWQRRIYVWALERGGLDAWLDRLLVRPFLRVFGSVDRLERRWVESLARPSVRSRKKLEARR